MIRATAYKWRPNRMTALDREEMFQIALACFQLGDMSEAEFRRRMQHDHALDEFEVAELVRQLTGDE